MANENDLGDYSQLVKTNKGSSSSFNTSTNSIGNDSNSNNDISRSSSSWGTLLGLFWNPSNRDEEANENIISSQESKDFEKTPINQNDEHHLQAGIVNQSDEVQGIVEIEYHMNKPSTDDAWRTPQFKGRQQISPSIDEIMQTDEYQPAYQGELIDDMSYWTIYKHLKELNVPVVGRPNQQTLVKKLKDVVLSGSVDRIQYCQKLRRSITPSKHGRQSEIVRSSVKKTARKRKSSDTSKNSTTSRRTRSSMKNNTERINISCDAYIIAQHIEESSNIEHFNSSQMVGETVSSTSDLLEKNSSEIAQYKDQNNKYAMIETANGQISASEENSIRPLDEEHCLVCENETDKENVEIDQIQLIPPATITSAVCHVDESVVSPSHGNTVNVTDVAGSISKFISTGLLDNNINFSNSRQAEVDDSANLPRPIVTVNSQSPRQTDAHLQSRSAKEVSSTLLPNAQDQNISVDLIGVLERRMLDVFKGVGPKLSVEEYSILKALLENKVDKSAPVTNYSVDSFSNGNNTPIMQHSKVYDKHEVSFDSQRTTSTSFTFSGLDRRSQSSISDRKRSFGFTNFESDEFLAPSYQSLQSSESFSGEKFAANQFPSFSTPIQFPKFQANTAKFSSAYIPSASSNDSTQRQIFISNRNNILNSLQKRRIQRRTETSVENAASSGFVAKRILDALGELTTSLDEQRKKLTPNPLVSRLLHDNKQSALPVKSDETKPSTAFTQDNEEESAMLVESIEKCLSSEKNKESGLNDDSEFQFYVPVLVPGLNTADINDAVSKAKSDISYVFSPPRKAKARKSCSYLSGTLGSPSLSAPIENQNNFSSAPSFPPTETPATSRISESLWKKPDQWKCETCLVFNDKANLKCIACETPKADVAGKSSASIKSGFPEHLWKKPGQWKCDTCLVFNDKDKIKCASCETPNPNNTNTEPGEPKGNDSNQKVSVTKCTFGTPISIETRTTAQPFKSDGFTFTSTVNIEKEAATNGLGKSTAVSTPSFTSLTPHASPIGGFNSSNDQQDFKMTSTSFSFLSKPQTEKVDKSNQFASTPAFAFQSGSGIEQPKIDKHQVLETETDAPSVTSYAVVMKNEETSTFSKELSDEKTTPILSFSKKENDDTINTASTTDKQIFKYLSNFDEKRKEVALGGQLDENKKPINFGIAFNHVQSKDDSAGTPLLQNFGNKLDKDITLIKSVDTPHLKISRQTGSNMRNDTIDASQEKSSVIQDWSSIESTNKKTKQPQIENEMNQGDSLSKTPNAGTFSFAANHNSTFSSSSGIFGISASQLSSHQPVALSSVSNELPPFSTASLTSDISLKTDTTNVINAKANPNPSFLVPPSIIPSYPSNTSFGNLGTSNTTINGSKVGSSFGTGNIFGGTTTSGNSVGTSSNLSSSISSNMFGSMTTPAQITFGGDNRLSAPNDVSFVSGSITASSSNSLGNFPSSGTANSANVFGAGNTGSFETTSTFGLPTNTNTTISFGSTANAKSAPVPFVFASSVPSQPFGSTIQSNHFSGSNLVSAGNAFAPSQNPPIFPSNAPFTFGNNTNFSQPLPQQTFGAPPALPVLQQQGSFGGFQSQASSINADSMFNMGSTDIKNRKKLKAKRPT